jgi:hypothetical protein
MLLRLGLWLLGRRLFLAGNGLLLLRLMACLGYCLSKGIDIWWRRLLAGLVVGLSTGRRCIFRREKEVDIILSTFGAHSVGLRIVGM